MGGSAEPSLPGIVVTFTDMISQRRLRHDLEQSHLDLETAYKEVTPPA